MNSKIANTSIAKYDLINMSVIDAPPWPEVHHLHHLNAGSTKSRNGEMRNEKLEMRKWKRKWKWSSSLLVDDINNRSHHKAGGRIGC